MIRAVRQLAGCVIGVAGVVLPAWAIFHLIRQPSCGETGPACPDEVGVWILALIGAILVLIPLSVVLAGRDRATGRVLLLGPVIVLAPLAFIAGVVVSLVGQSSDPDSRWVGFVLGGLAVLIMLRVIVGIARRVARATTVTTHPVQAAEAAAQMATLASTLEQVKQAKRAPKPDADLAARLRRLDELHAAGAIDSDEHRRRRDEILAEI